MASLACMLRVGACHLPLTQPSKSSGEFCRAHAMHVMQDVSDAAAASRS
jgi:hypothetical protein